MHIPFQLQNTVRLSCATQSGWKDLAWLFSQDLVCSDGGILAISFKVSLPHPMFEFDYAKARKAFEDPKVAKLFGAQGCGLNKNGGATKVLTHSQLLDLILEKPATYSVSTLGHVLGHALHPMVREMIGEHLSDNERYRIFERVGVNPYDRSELVIAFYIEPRHALISVNHRSETLRVNLTTSLLQDLFDGRVRLSLFNQYRDRIRRIEKAVRPKGPQSSRITQTFMRPGHHEGNPAASWPYVG